MLLGAAWLVTAEAKAESSEERASPAASSARTEVVLGTIGIHAQPVRGSLVALLRAELGRMKLSLIEKEQTGESPSAWAIESTRSGRVLAAILLDGRSEQGWRVVVIDAARGRAIARALPGGIRDDAASVEAVVSIIVSAASALREGLEVASKPVAAVVDGPSAPTGPVPINDTARAPLPAPPVSPRKDWSFRGSVGASVASFSPAAPTTEGLALALGVRFPARFEAHVFGTAFLPSLIRGPFGDFRVGRTFLGTAVGLVLGGPAFTFAPEAGIVAERALRYDAMPSAGVLATPPGDALYRVGGLLALRFRHTLLSPVSVELVAGMVYFGRRLEFTAKSPENSWSEGAWPAATFAQLGLEIATN
jgi:hypothetical protein